jgi:F-type H+-transporting ATPase subunit epsilon
MPLNLQIVTGEKIVANLEVDYVSLPGDDGVMGILPSHAPLFSSLQAGELYYRQKGEMTSFAIGGGFVEVFRDKVLVLADAAERSDEIDLQAAETARKKAEETLANRGQINEEDAMIAEAALRRALAQIDVFRRRGGRGGAPRLD